MSDVILKGERDGLAITIGPEGDFDEVCSSVVAHLERGGSFFEGANVLLDLGDRALTQEQLDTLKSLLSEYNVTLTALRGTDQETRSAARQMGLELPFLATPPAAQSEEFAPAETDLALIVRRTLRGGMAIHHPAGVVIIGDVNPGAEVVAGGDVIVFGALRGVVHAGAGGDEHCVVCALELAPTQLRISSQIARAPEEKRRRRTWSPLDRKTVRPEVARVHEGAIIVEPWTR